MKNPLDRIKPHKKPAIALAVGLIGVCLLLFYQLGTLTKGMATQEINVVNTPVGWHGLYEHAFYLPLEFLRSIVLFLFDAPGAFLIRTPNAVFGLLTVFAFAWLIKLWHGNRIALYGTALFATSAWVLHVSRFASFDILYLWGTTTLLLTHALLQRYAHRASVWYGSIIIWIILLYIPGMIWLVAVNKFLQRKLLWNSWRHFSGLRARSLTILPVLIGLPLLIINIMRSGQWQVWLGLPQSFPTPLDIVHNFGAVFFQLFIRGPENPVLWLGRTPVLDIFTLTACLVGIYFYVSHWRAVRSRVLGSFFLIGALLVSLHGPVSLSIVVPLLFVAAATGIAYLLHEWLQVFPLNPLARGVGIALISLAVVVSCFYNVRSYFIAWPHSTITHSLFRYTPK
jgi:hypothetical protein